MRNIIALSTTILALLASATASAELRPGGPVWSAEGRIDRRIELMTERLDLTAEQQAEIRDILEAQALTRREQRAAVRQQIEAVLTNEQLAMRDEEIARRVDRRVARLADRLGLSAEQEAEVRTLMGEPSDPADWDRGAMRERLAGILSDDQLAQLDAMGTRRGYRDGRAGGCAR